MIRSPHPPGIDRPRIGVTLILDAPRIVRGTDAARRMGAASSHL